MSYTTDYIAEASQILARLDVAAIDHMVIIKPMEEEATQAVVAKFEAMVANNGGVIDKIDRWGKRKLAYLVKDFTEGYYCIFHFTGKPETVAELNRVMKITDDILRHMIVKEDE